ncbi:MAG TPA: zf-HC2 domain-containing protein [Elusimicrobiales bacterium]|nr:zf-HC2 domain-containing protein [Elusimicrobiales bacterium]
MNCGYGEKLILYFYGELAGELKAGVERHLETCAACRGELAALEAAQGWLKASAAEPPAAAVAAVLAQARAAGGAAVFGFRTWGEALLAGALTALLAVGFSLPGRGTSPGLAWNSGLDSGLDSVEYSIDKAQADMAVAQSDWDDSYGLLEAESAQEV